MSKRLSFAYLPGGEITPSLLRQGERQEIKRMSKAVKYAERAVTIAAQGAWTVFEKLNSIRPTSRLWVMLQRLVSQKSIATERLLFT